MSATASEPDEDEHEMMRFLSAAKGVAYTQAEWEREVIRLEHEFADARRRHAIALREGYCRAERFDRV